MKNKKVLGIALGVVSVFVIGIVVAYAALSSTLNARFNSVTSQGLNWAIGFNNARYGYYNGWSDYYGNNYSGYWTSAYSYGGSTRSCGDILLDGNGVYLNDIEVSTPGDYCRYKLEIENSGNIDAVLSSISAIKPILSSGTGSCTTSGAKMSCGNVDYKLTTDSTGNSLLSQGTRLNAGIKKEVYLTVEYTGSSTNSSKTVWTGGGFNFNYSQA